MTKQATFLEQREAMRRLILRDKMARARHEAANAGRSMSCERPHDGRHPTCAGLEAAGPLGCLCPCHDEDAATANPRLGWAPPQAIPMGTDPRRAWLIRHGVEIKRGYAVLYKAVGPDLASRPGFIYAPGASVEAPDWKADQQCGGGLHFCWSPAEAAKYRSNDERTRYLACKVKVSEISVIDGGKVKASRCKVLFECDAHGTPASGGVAA